MIEYTFFGNCPSKKNGKQKIRRGGRDFWVPSKAYQAWEMAHKAALKAKFGTPNLTRFQIEIWPYFADNRLRDTDNLETSILDCLKAAGIIKDDRWQYHISPPIVHQPEIDPINPRVEIKIHVEESTNPTKGRSKGQSPSDRNL